MLFKLVAIPILKKVADALEQHVEESEAEWDNVLVGALKTVIEFFETPDVFQEQ
jgi:hypothetical protein